MTTQPNSQQLFGRKILLVAYSTPELSGPLGLDLGSGPAAIPTTPGGGIDLSNLHIQFAVRAADTQTPKSAVIRIFNLSDATSKRINSVGQVKGEFSRVILQAGYTNGSQYGRIFDGTIKQTRTGRLNGTDTFLEIAAADGDLGINFSAINTTLAPGASQQDIAAQINNATKGANLTFDTNQLPATGGILPRGKVLFGMARDHLRVMARTNEMTWSVQNGQIVFIPSTSYLTANGITVLNAKTGLIGVPEATQDGVRAQCLLNPNIEIGSRLQINNADLVKTVIREQGFPQYTSINYFATTPPGDGIYRALVIEHVGDTRGEDWYSSITCLALDPTAPADNSVSAYSQPGS